MSLNVSEHEKRHIYKFHELTKLHQISTNVENREKKSIDNFPYQISFLVRIVRQYHCS